MMQMRKVIVIFNFGSFLLRMLMMISYNIKRKAKANKNLYILKYITAPITIVAKQIVNLCGNLEKNKAKSSRSK